MKYLINGFSPKMIKKYSNARIKVEPACEEEINRVKSECVSAIGHHNIAEYLEIPRNRMNIILEKGDIAYLVDCRKIRKKEVYSYRKITIL